MERRSRLRLSVRGRVQGVGFRPHVYRLAEAGGLSGWVANTAQGAIVEVEGSRSRVVSFLDILRAKTRAPIAITGVSEEWVEPRNESGFQIRTSLTGGNRTAECLPDLATCEACFGELTDPQNRRFRYPFTACTSCGPRFSITDGLPYDRIRTSMQDFTQCAECLEEYESPLNLRFHAETNACPTCGPQMRLLDKNGDEIATRETALRKSVAALRAGAIIAVKGIGGFHLMLDARNEDAVQRLRAGKERPEKPFALLFPNIDSIQNVCRISKEEARCLKSPAAPIVLLQKRSESNEIANAVAPKQACLGAMLPSNPLHSLIASDFGSPLVATSGNISEEPICIEESQVVSRLRPIVDFFLTHNRRILRPVDDSVVRIVAGRPLFLRRSRGYAPLVLEFREPLGEYLAVGGHLKNTVALATGKRIVLSQHIGDLWTLDASKSFEKTVADLSRFYQHEPKAIVRDLHPDYRSSLWAHDSKKPIIAVPHHAAHVLAILADNRAQPPALGVAWDGTGLGEDGLFWGGEFFEVTEKGIRRTASLRPFPLPGGERAVREGSRVALALLYELWGDEAFSSAEGLALGFSAPTLKGLAHLMTTGSHCPRSTSVGRLFDGIAALLSIRRYSSYEGQAPQELEALAERSTMATAYPFHWQEGDCLSLDWRPLILQLLSDQKKGISACDLARSFHLSLVEMILFLAKRSRSAQVALGGGCFQNKLLTELVIQRLKDEGFTPLWSREVPPNDGGLAVGQIAKATWDANGRFICV